MTFTQMVDAWTALATGGLMEGLQGLGEATADRMRSTAQQNALSRMTPQTFRLYESIDSGATPLPAGVEIVLQAGGDLDSQHAVFQEYGWDYANGDGEITTRPGTFYLRDAFTDGLRPVEGELQAFLMTALGVR